MPVPRHPADRLPRTWGDKLSARFGLLAEAAGEFVDLECEPVGPNGEFRRHSYDGRLWLARPEYADAGMPNGRRAVSEAEALTELARIAAGLAGPEGLKAAPVEGLRATALLALSFVEALPEGSPARNYGRAAVERLLEATDLSTMAGG